jgi:hypothetical protein
VGADSADAASRNHLRAAFAALLARRGAGRAEAPRPARKRTRLETEAVFNTPPAALPREGRLVRYAPGFHRPSPADVRRIATRESRDPLGLPDWTEAERDLLFIAFAPELLVDEADAHDRPGALGFDHAGALWIDFFRPAVYRRLSAARLGGRWLPQLVYTAWFSAPAGDAGPAARHHSLTWRVTLGAQGEPLVFETMRDGADEHYFLPTRGVRPRAATADPTQETLFVPQALNAVQPGDRVLLRLESGSHHLQRVALEEGPSTLAALREARLYEMLEEDDLRSLPLAAGGRRSAAVPRVTDDPGLLQRTYVPH